MRRFLATVITKPSTHSSQLEASVKSHKLAVEVLGENAVAAFERDGFLPVVADNGEQYYVFDRISARRAGTAPNQRWNKLLTSPRNPKDVHRTWLVFGPDPHMIGDPFPMHPTERFFSFPSLCQPRMAELVTVVVTLMLRGDEKLRHFGDPLKYADGHRLKATDEILKRIGCDAPDYEKAMEEGARAWAENQIAEDDKRLAEERKKLDQDLRSNDNESPLES